MAYNNDQRLRRRLKTASDVIPSMQRPLAAEPNLKPTTLLGGSWVVRSKCGDKSPNIGYNYSYPTYKPHL